MMTRNRGSPLCCDRPATLWQASGLRVPPTRVGRGSCRALIFFCDDLPLMRTPVREVETRRDCVLQLRVAPIALPWVKG